MVLSFWGKHQPTSGAFPVAVEKIDEGLFVAYRLVMVIPWNCLLTCLVLILAAEPSSLMLPMSELVQTSDRSKPNPSCYISFFK